MATSDTLIRSSDREGEALAPKQARLIRSAYKVMGEKGLRHLSLQDVADEAGLELGRRVAEAVNKLEANLVAFSLLRNHVKERQIMIGCWH